MAFVGLSDSYEQQYQAIRRCWRFGQTEPVDVYLIASEAEGSVLANLQRKEQHAKEMMSNIVKHIAKRSLGRSERQEMDYREDMAQGQDWTLYLGDSVQVIDRLESESVGLIVFSPPFPGMYTYTNSPHDIGNTRNFAEMIDHYCYLVQPDKLLRVLKPGRMCCVHLAQAQALKGTDGYIGLRDFRGEVIRCMESQGWIYYSEVLIDKNPQVKAVRTKDASLQFKSLATDSARLRPAMADYVLFFRTPGENREPIRAGINGKLNPGGGWITNEEWIEWAAPVWYRAHPGLPGGIKETDVLNVAVARDSQDERHLCPLQLGVIERCIKLWSAPNDVVLDPFSGIGSGGYVALKHNRRFIGIELKESYWRAAIGYLHRAVAERVADRQPTLLDKMETIGS